MEFGINKKYLSFLLNPYLIYVYNKRNKYLKEFKDKSLVIGLYTSIKNSLIGHHVCLSSEVKLYNSEIGDHSYVNSKTIINYSKIGKFCSIASNVQFGLGIHQTNIISTHPAFYSNAKVFKTFADKNYFKEFEEISVGHDVWIGNNVVIMGGVNIGNGSIVAAGAVVTKDVKPYEVVGGIPAKHIKYRFDEELITTIQKTEWWNMDEKWFEKNYELFLDNDNFLNYFKNI